MPWHRTPLTDVNAHSVASCSIRVEIAKGPGAKGRRSSPVGYRYRGSPEAYRGDSYRDRERRRRY